MRLTADADRVMPPKPPGEPLPWLEPLKGLALTWIVLNHVVERLFGSPYFANPDRQWPNWQARWAQVVPLRGEGILLDLGENLVRYLGWLGDNGVGLMLAASGAGLAWSFQN